MMIISSAADKIFTILKKSSDLKNKRGIFIKRWQQLEIIIAQQHADSFADLLAEYNALAVSFVDAADEPLFQIEPNDTPLWQTTKLLALFPEAFALEPMLSLLKAHCPNQFSAKIHLIEDQDWVRSTQQNFAPQCFGNTLWVIPTWCDKTEFTGKVITVEPGLAFGTGTHPTTALCLEWLAKHPPRAQRVVDFGCGSGILALAASALGAKQVIAIDHDPQALTATQNNTALNPHLTNQMTLSSNAQLPALKADLILANILSGPLISLAPTITALCTQHTTLVLSGLLNPEIHSVARAYAPEFELNVHHSRAEWALLVLRKRPQ